MSASSPLLPRQDMREAALFFVVSALCFLAALAGLCARSAYAAADAWTDRVTGQITIRVRGDDAATAQAVTIARTTPGLIEAHALSRDEAEGLLKPWLGAAGVPADLPLPNLIAAEAAPGASGVGDRLSAALKAANINATVDDHVAFSADVAHATDSAGLAALAAVALLGATAIAVIAFATHSALLARRDIVEVLHLTGARDGYISGLFERRFLMLGVEAGACGALLAFAVAAFILFVVKQSDQRIWLLPQLSLSLADGMILGLTPLVAGVSAMIAARVTVLRSLSEMV
jgi:cell division transport system permease protein